MSRICWLDLKAYEMLNCHFENFHIFSFSFDSHKRNTKYLHISHLKITFCVSIVIALYNTFYNTKRWHSQSTPMQNTHCLSLLLAIGICHRVHKNNEILRNNKRNKHSNNLFSIFLFFIICTEAVLLLYSIVIFSSHIYLKQLFVAVMSVCAFV